METLLVPVHRDKLSLPVQDHWEDFWAEWSYFLTSCAMPIYPLYFSEICGAESFPVWEVSLDGIFVWVGNCLPYPSEASLAPLLL